MKTAAAIREPFRIQGSREWMRNFRSVTFLILTLLLRSAADTSAAAHHDGAICVGRMRWRTISAHLVSKKPSFITIFFLFSARAGWHGSCIGWGDICSQMRGSPCLTKCCWKTVLSVHTTPVLNAGSLPERRDFSRVRKPRLTICFVRSALLSRYMATLWAPNVSFLLIWSRGLFRPHIGR